MSEGCRFCRQDVSGQKRIKDRKGRYACRPCFERLQAKRAVEAEVKPTATSPGFDADVDTETIALETPPPVQMKTCQGCDAAMAPSAVFCVNCGMNTQTGQRAGKLKLGKSKSHRSRAPRERRRASSEPASGGEAAVILLSIAIVAGFFFGFRSAAGDGTGLLLLASFCALGLFSMVMSITLLFVSFRDGGVLQFLLVLLVPLYSLYWAFWRSSRLVRNSTLMLFFTYIATAASFGLNAMWISEGWVEQGSISGFGNPR